MKPTIEERVLDALDEREGQEAFTLRLVAGGRRPVRDALQRLREKGLAEPVHCPDGAWVWFRLVPREDEES